MLEDYIMRGISGILVMMFQVILKRLGINGINLVMVNLGTIKIQPLKEVKT